LIVAADRRRSAFAAARMLDVVMAGAAAMMSTDNHGAAQKFKNQLLEEAGLKKPAPVLKSRVRATKPARKKPTPEQK
jgi:hypothetical protein